MNSDASPNPALSSQHNLENKHAVFRAMNRIAEASPETVGDVLNQTYHSEAKWLGSHPMNEACGIDAIAETAWGPLLNAFPDLERRDLIVVGGRYEARDYVACVGHYCGTFKNPWLGIRPTGRPVYIRYGEVHQVSDGRIIKSHCLWDVLDVIRQAGLWPLCPSTATEGRWEGPLTGDGLVFTATDPEESAASLEQTLAMQKSLGANNGPEHFTREGLINMEQKLYWHPKMMWYGPSGIGTTRGLDGFVDGHQLPFRLAFPNRLATRPQEEQDRVKRELNAGHYIRVGDGKFSVTGGWPSVVSPHDGPFLGYEATGDLIQMRVMDFYHHHESLIRENWVPIDIIHILLQMGVDVMQEISS